MVNHQGRLYEVKAGTRPYIIHFVHIMDSGDTTDMSLCLFEETPHRAFELYLTITSGEDHNCYFQSMDCITGITGDRITLYHDRETDKFVTIPD